MHVWMIESIDGSCVRFRTTGELMIQGNNCERVREREQSRSETQCISDGTGEPDASWLCVHRSNFWNVQYLVGCTRDSLQPFEAEKVNSLTQGQRLHIVAGSSRTQVHEATHNSLEL
jgi:hypothetical protein